MTIVRVQPFRTGGHSGISRGVTCTALSTKVGRQSVTTGTPVGEFMHSSVYLSVIQVDEACSVPETREMYICNRGHMRFSLVFLNL